MSMDRSSPADTSASVPSAPVRRIIPLLVITVLLSLPRFAHQTPDSAHYEALSRYFRGEVAVDALETPFAFRPALPWLAAQVPMANLSHAFASINLLFTCFAYLLFIPLWKRLLDSRAEVNAALLLAVVSFPTLNYSTAVLTEPAAILSLTLGSIAILEGRWFLLMLLFAAGILVRETFLFLLPVAWFWEGFGAMNRSWWARRIAVTAIALFFFLLPRYCFAEAGGHFWYPGLRHVVGNLTRPVSWATSLLTLGIPLLLAIYGLFHSGGRAMCAVLPPRKAYLITYLASFLVLAMYSVLSAFMSGRFFWCFYPAFVPAALILSRGTPLHERVLLPGGRWIFGR